MRLVFDVVVCLFYVVTAEALMPILFVKNTQNNKRKATQDTKVNLVWQTLCLNPQSLSFKKSNINDEDCTTLSNSYKHKLT